MTNESTEYEQLTQQIYQSICNAEGVKNLSVQHNIKLPGKSGCNHQIDVFWEFNIMGVNHRVAIECKNYANEVSVGKVRDFFGVLHDVGSTSGIFVTKVGYQSGAKKFADYYNIQLKEMRFPNQKDWEGRVKNIILTIIALTIEVKEYKINLDFPWVFLNTQFKEGDEIIISGMANELKIVNEDDSKIETIYDIENALPRSEAGTDIEHSVNYDNHYIVLPCGQRFKINSIDFLYDVKAEMESSTSEGDAIARAILRDVTTGDIKFFDKNGNVRDVRGN